MAGQVHAAIVEAAVRWLKRNGCAAILSDPFRSSLVEQPDAIGWRDSISLTVEAKVSRSDFFADAKKPHRINPERAVGDWRFYATPTGLVSAPELPEGWGLLEWDGKSLKPVHGVPRGNCNWHAAPFRDRTNKRVETQLLVSAIHRPQFIPRPGVQLRKGIHFEAWKQHLPQVDGTAVES